MLRIEAHSLKTVIVDDTGHQLSLFVGEDSIAHSMRLQHWTIVQQSVTGQGQRVSLHHLDIAIGME